jgi:hypothetical protein
VALGTAGVPSVSLSGPLNFKLKLKAAGAEARAQHHDRTALCDSTQAGLGCSGQSFLASAAQVPSRDSVTVIEVTVALCW